MPEEKIKESCNLCLLFFRQLAGRRYRGPDYRVYCLCREERYHHPASLLLERHPAGGEPSPRKGGWKNWRPRKRNWKPKSPLISQEISGFSSLSKAASRHKKVQSVISSISSVFNHNIQKAGAQCEVVFMQENNGRLIFLVEITQSLCYNSHGQLLLWRVRRCGYGTKPKKP